MPGDPSLARLFREYGDRWEIEHVERSTQWVAVRRGSDAMCIIGAHDLGSLRHRIKQAEQGEPELPATTTVVQKPGRSTSSLPGAHHRHHGLPTVVAAPEPVELDER
jgi:hypothetical protein